MTDEEAATVSNNKDTTQLSSQEKRQNKKEKKFRERSEIARNGIDEANQYISEVHANTPPPQKKTKKSPASARPTNVRETKRVTATPKAKQKSDHAQHLKLINKEVDTFVAVDVDRDELQNKIEARGLHILTKRKTAGGTLLIFVNSNEIREQIN